MTYDCPTLCSVAVKFFIPAKDLRGVPLVSVLSLSYELARHGPVHAVFFYYMSNRVEHQKLNHEATELPPG